MDSLWLATHRLPPSPDEFTKGTHYDTIVAGGGLTGLATAAQLARAGHRVAVLEARFVGAVTTGNTTGKLSLLQGTTLHQIRHFHSDKVLRAYVDGNREAQAWLLQYLAERDVAVQQRNAYTYATTPDGTTTLKKEHEAALAAGLEVTWSEESELPFAVTGAIALADQAQFQPMEVLAALADDLRERGGVIIEGVRVTGAKGSHAPITVETSRGDVTADHLILCTGFPVLDRGGYFAKLTPLRSYALSFRVPGAPTSLPQGMYLNAEEPTRSLRTAPTGDDELLLVGGNGHVVGRSDSTQAAVDDLEAWTQEHFPGAERTHAWSSQDYQSLNRVPFIGKMPRGHGNIWMGTGYNKWGMTNAVAAALSISTQILGGTMEWSDVLDHRVTKPAGLASTAKIMAGVGTHLMKDWVQSELHALPDGDPAEGMGVVGRVGATPTARSTVDGKTCQVSGVCTHMGGILHWNDAEKSWDCPLHGSRFAPDGKVLEGPATQDLPD
ncbi:FAD-dependent oxidoreductase [Tessaracoccus antarcticus]|uniref:FAD-dependent oxidoreductase n=1 Tax=Tessaracoccus antarcticus TaxID=2479848 RepID=A0A3M0GFK9_9ACTN|nr:FAD-dependent oxidoreductase [Tessaracoccus antarcticus]RMB59909.1 FAD-dependent oxidoreductase [Tessaracoccus antarcticus]